MKYLQMYLMYLYTQMVVSIITPHLQHATKSSEPGFIMITFLFWKSMQISVNLIR